MAVHTLNLKDGSTIDVEAPLDTPVSELLVRANRQKRFTTPEPTRRRDESLASRMAAFDKPPEEVVPTRDEDDGTALGRGISRGIDSLQQNLGSAVEGIGGILGLEGLEKYGADVALANEAELQEAERNATRRQDVEGISTGASYVGELVGESAPQMGIVAAGSAAGAAYGGAAGAAFFGIGAVPGALIGGAIGGTLAAFPLFFGGNRERQKEAIERGERVEMSEGAAALTAIPQAALDSILTAFVGAKFFAKPGLDIAGGLLTRSVRGATKGVVTEIPTEVGQALLERAQAGLSITSEEAMREYGEAAIAAGILGGGIGGVSGAAQRAKTPEVAPETTPLQITDQTSASGPEIEITPSGTAVTTDQRVDADRVLGDMPALEVLANRGEPKPAVESGIASLVDPQKPTQETTQEKPKPAAAVETTQAELEQAIGKDPATPAVGLDVALGNSVNGLSVTGETDPSGSGKKTEIEAIEIRGKPATGQDGAEYKDVLDKNLPYGEPVLVNLPPKSKLGRQASVVVASRVKGEKGSKRDNFTVASVVLPSKASDAEIETAQKEALAQWQAAYGGVTATADVNLEAAPTALAPTTPASTAPTIAPAAPVTKADTVQKELEQVVSEPVEAIPASTPPPAKKEILSGFHATAGAPFERFDTANKAIENKRYNTNDGAAGPGDYLSMTSAYPSQFVGGKGSLMSADIDVSNMLDARLGKQKPFTDKQAERLKKALESRVDAEGNNIKVFVEQNAQGTRLTANYVRREEYGGEKIADRTMNRIIPLYKPEEAFIQIKTLMDNIKNPLARDAKGLSDERNNPSNTQNLRTILEESGFTGVIGAMDATGGGRDNIVVYNKSVYQNNGKLKTLVDQDTIPNDLGTKPRKITAADVPVDKLVAPKTKAKEKKPDVKTTEIKSKTSGDSVPTPKSDVGSKPETTVPSAAVAAKGAKKPTAPRTSGVGSSVVESGSATRTTGTKPDTLERSLSRDATPGKQTEKTPAQPIPVELKEAKAKRVAAEKATTPRESLKFADQKSDEATKTRAETAKTKEADTKQAAVFAAQDTVIQKQGTADSDLIAPQAPIAANDKNKILKLMETKRTKAPSSQLANAVQKYFNQFPTFTAALDAAIYDVSMQIPTRKKDAIEYKDDVDLAKFYTADPENNLPSMGKVSARKITDWLTSKDTNMSVELREYVTTELQKGSQARVSQANYVAGDRVAKARSELTPDELADLEIISDEDFQLPAEFAVDTPLRPSVKAAILEGDLAGALNALRFTAATKDIALLSKRLMENIGNTKLITKKNLKADDGFTRLAGYFDPETNTIALDKKTGINAHALLHEMLHAVTSTTLANKAHPLTKKLTKIYEGSKEQLAGEYGITSLDEFVAEAMANPDFQTQLKTTTVNGRNPWQQMTRAIANFVRTLLGRPTVSEDTTFDAVDKLVQEIITPTYDGRAATKLYMAVKTPAGAAKFTNDQASKNTTKVITKKQMYDYVQQGRGFMGSKIPLSAKRVWLRLQPVNILAELSESRIRGAKQLNTIINNMSSALRKRNESLDPIIGDLKAFRRNFAEKYAILQSLVPNASYERIDPREATFEKAYGYKKSDARYDEKSAKEIYKDLRAQYLKMGKEGQNLYRVITNTFEQSLKDVMGAVEANLAATIPDAKAQKRARDKLAELLNMQRGVIKPFAPLTRFGQHRLQYNALDPKTGQPETFVEYFTTVGQRERAKVKVQEYNKKSLAKLPANDPKRAQISTPMKEGTASSIRNYKDAPEGSFVFEVVKALQAEGASEAMVNRVVDLAIDTMPARSFMQSFRVRGDVRGFKGDITPTEGAGDKRLFGLLDDSFNLVDMVQSKGRDYNRQLVQMEYGAKIQAFKNTILKPLTTEETDATTMLYRDTLEQIANFAQSPDIPKWSQSLTSAGYAWTMGWNFSSAAITTFDVFMSTAPRLMGKYGDTATFKAMGKAAALLAKSPKFKMVDVMDENGKMKPRKVKTGAAGFSIGNYDYTDPNLSQDMKDIGILAEVATENAQINQSLNQEELDMGNAKSMIEKAASWTSFLFHHSERYNREIAMTATYTLELDRMKAKKGSALTDLEKRKAAALAVTETEFTLGATASAGRPVYAQSGIGNVAMLFKRFAISKYHMMATMTNDAFQAGGDANTKENRKIAQRSLGRFFISTGLFAGIAGMPLMGALGFMFDTFILDEDEDNFNSMVRKVTGEGFYNGIINEALGVDVASRIGLNSLLYRPPIIEKDQAGLITLIEQLGGPIIGIYLSMDRGYDQFSEGEILKGVKSVVPAALRNVIKGGEQLATGEVATRRGDAVVEDIGISQILLQIAGFANNELNKQYDYNKNERSKTTYLGKKRTMLLRRANIAAANGDSAAYRSALKDIQEYNQGLPREARRKYFVLPDTIKRSRKSFNVRTGKMIGGIEYTPMMRRSLEEYDQGIQFFN